jgi:cytochrome c-550 PedF
MGFAEKRSKRTSWFIVVALLAVLAPVAALSHGDVNPQPVATKGLKPLGEEWLKSNPYRGDKLAIAIGKSAYNQQCARCHGLEGISGGLAPDLRSLALGDEGDKDYLPPVRKGVARDGRVMMPKYEGVMSQDAMWAIRTFLETIHVD